MFSPSGHSAFSDSKGLIEFVATLRKLSNGKPIGFKLCIGKTSEFKNICQEMIAQNCYTNFITVDGTGVGPLEFVAGVRIPLEPALIFVNKTLVRYDLKTKIRAIR